jgi:hypothetical protein
MGFGAAMRRTKLIGDVAIDGFVNVLILVVTPCVIVDVFQRPFDQSSLSSLGLAFAIAVIGHLVVIPLAMLLVRHRDENVRKPLLLAAVFSNAGFMGIPLEQAILGDRGVFFGASYIVVFNLFIWSWGLKVMKGNGERLARRSLGEGGGTEVVKMVLNPGTIGIALGLPLFLFSARLPSFLAVPVHHLANLNTPIAMIVIGYGLAGAKLGQVARNPSVYVASLIRLVGYPLLFIAAMYPFRDRLDRDMMLAMCIAASAPVAAMVSMFATKFRRDVDTGVAVVSGTTLLSILTMPAVVALAMSLL